MGRDKYNVFQGNMALKKTVAETLGLELDDCQVDTKEIYFTTFFYLCYRFGNTLRHDIYQDSGIWDFTVKNYTIRVYIDSTDVNFIVFGDYRMSNQFTRNCYWVKLGREREKKKHLLIQTNFFHFSDKRSEYELEKIENIMDRLRIEKNMPKNVTDEILWQECGEEVSRRIDTFNNEILGVKFEDYEKYGDYSNAKIMHALKTLRQFLNNMLTPIWVRDCAFNIKGRMSDTEVMDFCKWNDNIKIEFQEPEK